MIWLASLASLVAGIGLGWTASGYAVGKRQAARDDLNFHLAPTVEHSVERAAREAGV